MSTQTTPAEATKAVETESPRPRPPLRPSKASPPRPHPRKP
jgi:hypothetical protein